MYYRLGGSVFGRWAWLVLLLGVVHPLPTLAQQWSVGRAAVNLLGSQGYRAFELARLRVRDPRLGEAPVYQGLWLRESNAPDSSVFDLLPFASAPRGRDGVALAFDQGIGRRMWSGFTDASPSRSALLGSAARGLLSLWRRLPALNGGPRDLMDARTCPGMRLRLGTEALFGFGTDGRDTPPEARAIILYADCQRDLGGSWRLSAGLRGYHWRTPGFSDRQDLESSFRIARTPAGQGFLVFLDGSWTPRYERAILHVERPFPLAGLQLRPLLRVGWGDEVPFGLGFWPGGFDGFPGLRDGEGRGDRELTLGLDLKRPIVGKLSVRALFAAGTTANGGPLLPRTPLLFGARAGLNLETRFGLIRVEYGRATQQHRAFFVRLGRIF
jgi:hypothetical protein